MDKQVMIQSMERMKQMRIEKGFTQSELAEKLGTAVTNIARWESGNTQISLLNALRIADLFDLSLDELYLPKEKRKHVLENEVLKNEIEGLREQVNSSNCEDGECASYCQEYTEMEKRLRDAIEIIQTKNEVLIQILTNRTVSIVDETPAYTESDLYSVVTKYTNQIKEKDLAIANLKWELDMKTDAVNFILEKSKLRLDTAEPIGAAADESTIENVSKLKRLLEKERKLRIEAEIRMVELEEGLGDAEDDLEELRDTLAEMEEALLEKEMLQKK